MKSRLIRIIFLAIAVISHSLSAAASDPNRDGFELLKRGKFKEAESLLSRTLEKDPSNPVANLNMARIRYQLASNKDVDALFKCETDLSHEPIADGYAILWYLTRAVESRKSDIYQQLKDDDRWLMQFRLTGMYQRWIRAIQKIPTGKEKKELIAGSEWWPYANSRESWNVVFKFDSSGRVFKSGPDGKRSVFGSWELAKANEIVLKPTNGGKSVLRLSQIRTPLGKSNRYLLNIGLVATGKTDPVYILGPRVGDCGKHNY